jgi:uncharacterized protein (DUF305 family)
MKTMSAILLALSVAGASVGVSYGQSATTCPTICPSDSTIIPCVPTYSGQASLGAGPALGNSFMVVDECAVYVLRGDEVFKLSKEGLQLLCRTTLPCAQMPSATGAGPSGPSPNVVDISPDPCSPLQLPEKNVDRAYLQLMVPYESGDIAMAKVALVKACQIELRKFAQRVVDTRNRRICTYSSWLHERFGAPVSTKLSAWDQDEVCKLGQLTGKDFEVEYMRAMIVHDDAAVQFGEDTQARACTSDVRLAARNMVREESCEVEQLKGWLADWYCLDTGEVCPPRVMP